MIMFFVGEICMFGFNCVFVGWLFCDGCVLFIVDNEVLYMLLGIIYGGNGFINFVLFDLCGCLFFYQGIGVGFMFCFIGQVGGVEQVILIQVQMFVYIYVLLLIIVVVIVDLFLFFVVFGFVSGEIYYVSDIIGGLVMILVLVLVIVVGGNLLYENCMFIFIVQYFIVIFGIYLMQS